MIRLRDVDIYIKDRQDRSTLRCLSMAIARGVSVGVLGRRGSGKEAFLKLLAGLIRPLSGTRDVDGRVSLPAGTNPGVTPRLTGRVNAAYVARVLGNSPTAFIQNVEYLFDEPEHFEQPLSEWPIGLRQRYIYALSLGGDFDWYLSDEQLWELPQAHRKRYIDWFLGKRDSDAIVMATNKPRHIMGRCDAVVVLNQGAGLYFPDVEEGIGYYRHSLQQKSQEAKQVSDKTQ